MKLLPALLLNIVVAGAAVVVYDQLRADDVREQALTEVVQVDTSDLEERLAALEAREQPLLQAAGSDPQTTAKLSELDRRLQALENARATEPGASELPEPKDPKPDDPLAAPGEEPTPEDITRFHKLQEAAKREARRKNDARRIGRLVEKLEISLSERQQEQLVAAYAAFQPRRNEIWGEAKRSGAAEGGEANWEQIIGDASARIEREFAEQITEFIPRTDAEAIAAGLGGK